MKNIFIENKCTESVYAINVDFIGCYSYKKYDASLKGNHTDTLVNIFSQSGNLFFSESVKDNDFEVCRKIERFIFSSENKTLVVVIDENENIKIN